MSKRAAITNLPDSLRQRLRNVARQLGEDNQVVLIRYATERLLYRISVSRYRDAFVLKGAWLFYVWGINRRATRDVDFLARVGNQPDQVRAMLQEVIAIRVPQDDGLSFDPESIAVEQIQLDGDYSGVRARLIAHLGNTSIHTQIDLGFSEVLVEEPVLTELPVLLEYDPPRIRAYSAEVVIAEKTEAIVKLGTINTRFKDFFDIYVLAAEKDFEGSVLLAQVIATFTHRGTALPAGVPAGLSDVFGHETLSQRQWQAFVRRNDVGDAPEDFADVVAAVRGFLGPVLTAAAGSGNLGDWVPGVGWSAATPPSPRASSIP